MSATTRAYTHRIQPFRFPLVPVAGLEPARPYGRRILSVVCLPISSDWHRKRSTAFYGALVPPVGLEPTRSHERHILSVVCLPIPPQRQKKKGAETNTRDNHAPTVRPTGGTHAHQPHHRPAQPACADALNRPTQTGPNLLTNTESTLAQTPKRHPHTPSAPPMPPHTPA